MKRRTFLWLPLGAASAAAGWTPLIRGNSLAGWKTEGKADWTVRDGSIIGRQGTGAAPGDLFSEARWADFELEGEWQMHWPGNSGIWFRYSGPKTGYQADILDEPAYPGVFSGSLYCMGKAFIAENRDPQSVRKNGWNRVRIRARGDSIAIEQNGRRIVDVRDTTFPGPGSVGIQVHPGKQFEGMEIRVRNLRLRPL